MSRIKGKYAANIIIEWDNERKPNTLPIEQINDNAKFISRYVADAIRAGFKGTSNVEVKELSCGFYEMEVEHE